jgi:hypothetical protein
MAVASFEDLCAGFCDIVKVAPPQLQEDDQGRVAFHVKMRGATVNMVHCPHTHPDHLFLVFELGPLATGDADAARELKALLDANFMLQVHAPVFSRNPATGNAVLQYVYPLFDATPSGLYELIDKGVDWSSRWREHLAPSRPGSSDATAPQASQFAMLNLA